MPAAELERTTTSAATSDTDIDHLVRRIWGEYLEMPGLRLTRPRGGTLGKTHDERAGD